MKITLGKIIGRIDGQHWGQVYDFRPDDADDLSRRGRLLVAAGVTEEEDAGQVKMMGLGREVLSFIQGNYYQSREDSAMAALKQTGEAVLVRWPRFNGIIGAAFGNIWYIAAVGGGGVWSRQGEAEGWVLPVREEGGGGGSKRMGETGTGAGGGKYSFLE